MPDDNLCSVVVNCPVLIHMSWCVWLADPPLPHWASFAPVLARATVEVGDGNTRQVDSFQAPNINGGHAIALWIRSLSVRVYPTNGTEAMLDHVLVERVGARVFLERQEAKAIAGDGPQEASPCVDR